MTPPPALPPLRAPLPSLFSRQQLHGSKGDATAVPPLRRHSISETVAFGAGSAQRETARSGEEHDAAHKKRGKRARDFVRAPRRNEGDVHNPCTDTSRAKKSASVVKREEREDLFDQVRALEEQIDALKRCAGLPTSQDKAEVEDIAIRNYDIEEALHKGGQYLGRLDSMITNELLLPKVNPISTFIHLPRDMDQRRDILRGMQDLKLRRGIEVATSWLHHLDHNVPYLSEEAFTSVMGEYHYHRLEITQFSNFKTARQLFDVYVEFLNNVEIGVTEKIGQLALCEDMEDICPLIWNHRILTVAHEVGFTEELNIVDFAKFYSYSPYTNSPMGIIARDTVNVDDLYPYVPEERTCKDIQVACMILELTPQFPYDPRMLKRLQDNTPKWPKAFMKYLHEYDAPQSAEPAH